MPKRAPAVDGPSVIAMTNCMWAALEGIDQAELAASLAVMLVTGSGATPGVDDPPELLSPAGPLLGAKSAAPGGDE